MWNTVYVGGHAHCKDNDFKIAHQSDFLSYCYRLSLLSLGFVLILNTNKPLVLMVNTKGLWYLVPVPSVVPASLVVSCDRAFFFCNDPFYVREHLIWNPEKFKYEFRNLAHGVRNEQAMIGRMINRIRNLWGRIRNLGVRIWYPGIKILNVWMKIQYARGAQIPLHKALRYLVRNTDVMENDSAY